MKVTGFEVFNSTIERTNLWIHDLMRELNWNDYRKSYLALRFVLQGLRDHLPVKDAVHFGNQLPMLIRGFYFEDWDLDAKPTLWNSRDDAKVIVRAVFRLLERKASDGEIENLEHLLPSDLRELWPQTLRAA